MSALADVEAINLAVQPLNSDRAVEYLGRSLYDVNLSDVVSSLANGDESIPFLAANALRPKLAKGAGNIALQWSMCSTFVEHACSEALKDTSQYGKKIVNATRNTPKYDDSRREANGMVCHGGWEASECATQTAGYGLLWTYENEAYRNIPAKGKIVASLGTRNLFNIEIRGDWDEVVHPALILNSAIEVASIYYDIRANRNSYTSDARCLQLRPGGPNSVELWEHIQQQTKLTNHGSIKSATKNNFEQVGELKLALGGQVSIAASDYYQEVISSLLPS